MMSIQHAGSGHKSVNDIMELTEAFAKLQPCNIRSRMIVHGHVNQNNKTVRPNNLQPGYVFTLASDHLPYIPPPEPTGRKLPNNRTYQLAPHFGLYRGHQSPATSTAFIVAPPSTVQPHYIQPGYYRPAQTSTFMTMSPSLATQPQGVNAHSSTWNATVITPVPGTNCFSMPSELPHTNYAQPASLMKPECPLTEEDLAFLKVVNLSSLVEADESPSNHFGDARDEEIASGRSCTNSQNGSMSDLTITQGDSYNSRATLTSHVPQYGLSSNNTALSTTPPGGGFSEQPMGPQLTPNTPYFGSVSSPPNSSVGLSPASSPVNQDASSTSGLDGTDFSLYDPKNQPMGGRINGRPGPSRGRRNQHIPGAPQRLVANLPTLSGSIPESMQSNSMQSTPKFHSLCEQASAQSMLERLENGQDDTQCILDVWQQCPEPTLSFMTALLHELRLRRPDFNSFKAYIDAVDSTGKTPTIQSVEYARPDLVKLFCCLRPELSCYAVIPLRSQQEIRVTALLLAVYNGQKEIVEILVNHLEKRYFHTKEVVKQQLEYTMMFGGEGGVALNAIQLAHQLLDGSPARTEILNLLRRLWAFAVGERRSVM